MFLLNVKHQIPSTQSAFQSAVWLWHKKWYYSKSKLKFRKAQNFTVKAHSVFSLHLVTNGQEKHYRGGSPLKKCLILADETRFSACVNQEIYINCNAIMYLCQLRSWSRSCSSQLERNASMYTFNFPLCVFLFYFRSTLGKYQTNIIMRFLWRSDKMTLWLQSSLFQGRV